MSIGRVNHLLMRPVETGVAEDARQRLAECYAQTIEKSLEEGHGPAFLCEPEVAEMISNTLKHFEGERYELLTWCVMPNHVHALIRPLGEHSVSSILKFSMTHLVQ